MFSLWYLQELYIIIHQHLQIMKNLNQSPPKIRTVALIIGLIFSSVLLSSGCEKDNIEPDPNPEGTFKDPNDNMPSCWTMLENMKKKKNGHMIATLENKIYVAGGFSKKSGNTFESYDPGNDSWEALTKMPTAREWGSACAINGKLYFIGGWFEEETLNIVEAFDPQTNRWTSMTPMPSRRWGHAAFAFEDKIYVIGGVLDWPLKEYYKTVEIYDPESDTWTTKRSKASSGMIPRWGFGTCVANRKVYVIGGVDCWEPPWSKDVNALSTVEVYNPVNNTWEEKSSMPTARWGLSVVNVDNMIYAMGGSTAYFPTKKLSTMEVYHPDSDTWTIKSRLPKGIIGLAACTLNSLIYVTGGGGIDPIDEYGGVYMYNPSCDSGSE